jgi:hypothetical protein
MADKRWVSTTGDLNAAASYSPSGVPGAGDSLYFDGTSNMDVLSNLNALQSFAITRIWIQKAYQGNIGAVGNPMIVGPSHLVHNGSGSVYHESNGSSSYIVIDSPNLQDAYTLTSTGGSAGLTNVWAVVNGSMDVLDNTANTTLGALIVGPGRVAPPTVTIGRIAASFRLRQSGGYVVTKTPLGNNSATDRSVLDGGTLVYDVAGTAKWTQLEIAGGRMEFNGGVIGGVCIDECVISSGVLDMTKDSRAKTITKLTILPGGEFLTHRNITVTTLIDLRGDYPILP